MTAPMATLGTTGATLVCALAALVWLPGIAPGHAGPAARSPAMCPDTFEPAPGLDPERAPEYSRSMWLRDAVRIADLVVRGEVLAGGAPVLRVAEVLCHASWGVSEDQQELPLVAQRLPAAGQGIFLLARAPRGYLVLDPDGGPVTSAEWRALAAGQASAGAPAVDLHESDHQLYRAYRRDGNEIWHGAETSVTGGLWMVSLYQHGALVIQLGFEQGRLERVSHVPARGRGFFVQYRQGVPWRFEHYRDGKKDGLSREYDAEAGRIEEEARFRAGVRHGLARSFDARGRVSRQARYENGLVLPVVRPTVRGGRPAPGASLTPLEDGRVHYAASRELMARIRPGMTARQVADLLGLPVSPAMGVVFPTFLCDEALHVEFRGRRVSRVYRLPNGAHCM
jgi:hypothetical protein